MLYFLRRTFEQRTRVREAIPMPEALIDLRTFALEEYKAIQAKINQFRDTAGRLETFTIGGTVVAVGILLGIGHEKSDDIPLWVWWALFFIVLAATLRCWSHYYYTGLLRNYVMQIEKNERAAGYALPGVETYSEGKWLTVVYVAVLFISITVVGTVLALAISKTLGHL
jgi:hypothetical protein